MVGTDRARLGTAAAAAVALAVGLVASTGAAAPDVVVENAGDAAPAFPIETSKSADAWYDYRNGCGHPGFGVVDESHLFLLDADQGVYLGVLHDKCDAGSTDKYAEFIFENLPSGFWAVEDDPDDFDSDPTHILWEWHPGYTDGGLFQGDLIPGASITVHPSWSGWSPTWQYVSGPDAGTDLSLQRDKATTLHLCPDEPDADLSKNLDGLAGDNGWFTSPVLVELDASVPAPCGPLLDGIEYRLDGDLHTYDGPFEVADDGVHQGAFHAVDPEGDTSSQADLGFKIDKTEPTVTLQEPGDGEVHVDGTQVPSSPSPTPAVATGETTVEAGAADNTSGVREVAFKVDGDVRSVDGTAPYTFNWSAGDEAAGAHEVAAVAHDVAGHADQDTRTVWTIPSSPAGLQATIGPAP